MSRKWHPLKSGTFVCIFTPFSRPSHRHVFPLLRETVILQESNQGKSDNLCTCTIVNLIILISFIVTRNFKHKVDLLSIKIKYPHMHTSTGVLTHSSSLSVQEVARFLDTKHEGHYKVYNLCSKFTPPRITCTALPLKQNHTHHVNVIFCFQVRKATTLSSSTTRLSGCSLMTTTSPPWSE